MPPQKLNMSNTNLYYCSSLNGCLSGICVNTYFLPLSGSIVLSNLVVKHIMIYFDYNPTNPFV